MKRAGYWCAISFLSAMIVLIFFCSPGINTYERVDFGDLMHGQAWKPFVYRTLLPSTVRAISWATPPGLRSYVNGHPLVARALATERIQKHLLWNPDYVYEYFVTYGLLVASVIGFVIVIRRLFAACLSSPPYVHDFVGLLALLGLPPFFRYVTYIYDFPTLLLYSLCLLLMVRRRWAAYCMTFVLCALSKETSILLIAIYLLTFRRDGESRRLFDGLLAFQVTVYVAVKGLLTFVYRDNPGSAVEFHLGHNLTLPPYGPEQFVAWCAVLLAVIYHWRAKPILIRNTVLMVFPLLGLTFFLGLIDELRDYYEVYPGIVVAIGYTVCRAMAVPCEVAAPTTRTPVRGAEGRAPVASRMPAGVVGG